jgi:hypothetical protein
MLFKPQCLLWLNVLLTIESRYRIKTTNKGVSDEARADNHGGGFNGSGCHAGGLFKIGKKRRGEELTGSTGVAQEGRATAHSGKDGKARKGKAS